MVSSLSYPYAFYYVSRLPNALVVHRLHTAEFYSDMLQKQQSNKLKMRLRSSLQGRTLQLYSSVNMLQTWLDFLWIATTDRFLLYWRFHRRIILMTQHTILSFLAWSTYFPLNQWRQIGDENWLCPCNMGELLGAFTLWNCYSFCAYCKHYFVSIMRCRPTSWITAKIKTTFMLCFHVCESVRCFCD